MRYLTILALATLFACKHDIEPTPSPTDASRIVGEWVSMIPDHPEWKYSFDDGLLTQSIVDFGVQITVQQYVYATRQDTVFISGTGGQRTWVVYFECDEIVRAREMDVAIGAVRWLKRVE